MHFCAPACLHYWSSSQLQSRLRAGPAFGLAPLLEKTWHWLKLRGRKTSAVMAGFARCGIQHHNTIPRIADSLPMEVTRKKEPCVFCQQHPLCPNFPMFCLLRREQLMGWIILFPLGLSSQQVGRLRSVDAVADLLGVRLVARCAFFTV